MTATIILTPIRIALFVLAVVSSFLANFILPALFA